MKGVSMNDEQRKELDELALRLQLITGKPYCICCGFSPLLLEVHLERMVSKELLHYQRSLTDLILNVAANDIEKLRTDRTPTAYDKAIEDAVQKIKKLANEIG
jgi:uncharacterized protein YllA (UPF0747 family)